MGFFHLGRVDVQALASRSDPQSPKMTLLGLVLPRAYQLSVPAHSTTCSLSMCDDTSALCLMPTQRYRNTMFTTILYAPAQQDEPYRIWWRPEFSRESSHEQKSNDVSPEVRERAVRLVREQRSEHP